MIHSILLFFIYFIFIYLFLYQSREILTNITPFRLGWPMAGGEYQNEKKI